MRQNEPQTHSGSKQISRVPAVFLVNTQSVDSEITVVRVDLTAVSPLQALVTHRTWVSPGGGGERQPAALYLQKCDETALLCGANEKRSECVDGSRTWSEDGRMVESLSVVVAQRLTLPEEQEQKHSPTETWTRFQPRAPGGWGLHLCDRTSGPWAWPPGVHISTLIVMFPSSAP